MPQTIGRSYPKSKYLQVGHDHTHVGDARSAHLGPGPERPERSVQSCHGQGQRLSGRTAAAGSDAGSAVVDFVLVGALLTLLFMSIIQLALVLHVRNTLIDAAASGARYGTLADRTPADGAERTADLIRVALNDSLAEDVSYAETTHGGVRMLQITVRAPLPVVGLLGPSGGLEVTGHGVWGYDTSVGGDISESGR